MNSFTSLASKRTIADSHPMIAGNNGVAANNLLPSSTNSLRRSARRIFRSINTASAIAAIFALTSCAIFSSKVDLKKIPVVAIDVAQANGPGIAPGDKSPLVVTVTDAKGKQLKTEGKGKGPVRWRDLAVTSTVTSVNNKGVLALPKDPRLTEGQLPHVSISVPSHPDVKPVALDVPIRYDRAFTIGFAGPSGSSGSDGQDGTDGSSGSIGSTDPDHPSPGGDGSNGGNGTNGGDGGPGGDGPPVRVMVAIHYRPFQVSNASPADAALSTSSAANGPAPAALPNQTGAASISWESGPLLQVSVTSGRTQELFLVDPHGGSLTITSDGGSGGSGGRGGRGGRGGSGGSGIPSGSNGMSGSDGMSGNSGPAGRGGPIFVTYDPRVKAYLGAIQLRSPGGPRPVLSEANVAPLW